MEVLLIVIVIINKRNYSFLDCLTAFKLKWLYHSHLWFIALSHTLFCSFSFKLHGPHLKWPKTSPLSWIRPPSLNSTPPPPTTYACLPKTRSERADQATSWPSPQMKPVSIFLQAFYSMPYFQTLCYLWRHLVAQCIISSVWPACDRSSTWWRSSRSAAGSDLIPRHQSHVEGTTEELLTHGRERICKLFVLASGYIIVHCTGIFGV